MVLDPRAPQPAGRNVQLGVEFVQVPAKLTADPRALGDQVITVVSQQLHLTGGAVQVRHGQVWFA